MAFIMHFQQSKPILLQSGTQSIKALVPLHRQIQTATKSKKKQQLSIDSNIISRHNPPFDVKGLLKTLTLPRLRKMQALVRGFLCRRITLPNAVQDHNISLSILHLVQQRFIRKELHSIASQQLQLQPTSEYIFDTLLTKIIRKDFSNEVRDAITNRAVLLSRPLITFGFNLRDGLELLLYEVVSNFISKQVKDVVAQCIDEETMCKRELAVTDALITQPLRRIITEVVEECILQCMDQYITQSILDNVCREGALVAADSVYREECRKIEHQQREKVLKNIHSWIIQKGIFEIMFQSKNMALE